MKIFYVCPKCEKQIDPITVTPNSLSILRFLNKTKESISQTMVEHNVMKGYGRSTKIGLSNLYRDFLIDIDFIDKKGIYQPRYYKISSLGKKILKVVRK